MPNKLCPYCNKPVPKGQGGGTCMIDQHIKGHIHAKFEVFDVMSEEKLHACDKCIGTMLKLLIRGPK